jgi:hypothetical protein
MNHKPPPEKRPGHGKRYPICAVCREPLKFMQSGSYAQCPSHPKQAAIWLCRTCGSADPCSCKIG